MSDETQTQTESATVGIGEGDIAAVRELVLKAHPNVVPELVRGVSVAELTASIPAAEEAYQRIAAALTGANAAQEQETESGASPDAAGVDSVTPPAVPAGGGANAIDWDKIPATEKIRRGLEQMHRDAGRK